MRRARYLAPWRREDLDPGIGKGADARTAAALSELRGKPALYHCLSRVVNREFVLGSAEKEHFVRLLRLYERFCRVRVLAFCVMSNHFHLLVEVPERPPDRPSDEEFLAHLAGLYERKQLGAIRWELEHHRAQGNDSAAEKVKDRFLCRMYDLSAFMKVLKQRFTQWFNPRHNRRGTLWEDRFKSVLVEDGHAARVVAAYIDLNPVRAGITSDPKDYRWCSYGEAVAGGRGARAGLQRVLFEKRAATSGEIAAAQEVSSWRKVAKLYRLLLFLDGRASPGEKEGGTRRPGAQVLSEERVRKALAAGGDLPEREALRCRLRYLADGLVIGSREFVNQAFHLSRGHFSTGRTSGARKMRGVESPLHTMRDLQVRAIG